jgi:hypothetical protein
MSGKLDALRRIGLLGLLSVGVSCSCHRATPGDSPASVTIQATEAGTASETTPRPQELNDAGGTWDGGTEEGGAFALDLDADDGGPLMDSLGRPFLVPNWDAAADKITTLPEFRHFADNLDRESHGEARVGLYPEKMPQSGCIAVRLECLWGYYVGLSRPYRQLWQRLYVDASSGRVYGLNPTQTQYITYEEWRKRFPAR